MKPSMIRNRTSRSNRHGMPLTRLAMKNPGIAWSFAKYRAGRMCVATSMRMGLGYAAARCAPPLPRRPAAGHRDLLRAVAVGAKDRILGRCVRRSGRRREVRIDVFPDDRPLRRDLEQAPKIALADQGVAVRKP